MKTAKEWAESVVVDADRDAGRLVSRLRDPEDDELAAWLQVQQSWRAELAHADNAREVIERLVERVQADARAPLEEEIARLRKENERLNAEHADYLAFIADANDMLAEEHEQARRLGE